MRMGKWISITAMAALLCSCSLLPQEEEYVSMPVIRSYEQREYELSYVQFGDVTLTETLPCKYMPVSTEQLVFPVGGVYYNGIYVEKGDIVHKGDLLAQLDVTALLEEQEQLETQRSKMQQEMDNLIEQRTLAVDSQRRILSVMSPDEAARQKTPEEVQREYDVHIQRSEEDIALCDMRLEEVRQKIAQRSLYAGIDGAVTYVRPIDTGAKSSEGELVVSIADATNSVFSAETLNYALLETGTEVSILSKKEYLSAVTVSAEELSLEEAFSKTGKKTVYFRLLAPNADLESGDRGTLTLTVAVAEDVLFIDKDALHTVDGRNFVYQMDENGLKTMVDVEIGLVSNNYVEIRSGLSEGDNVIL